MIIKILLKDDNGQVYEGEIILKKIIQNEEKIKIELEKNDDPIEQLAKKCGTTKEKLSNVITFENNEFILLRRINEDIDTKKQILASHCILTAYMKGLDQEWIPASILRTMVDKNGLGDGGNLARTLGKIDIFRIKGTGKSTMYSLTTDGWQKGLELLKSLA